MSERLPVSPEQQLTQPEAPRAPEKLPETAEKGSDAQSEQQRLAEIQQSIERHAVSGKELTAQAENDTGDGQKPPQQHFVNRQFKQQSLERSLTRVRKQLNPAEKALSRLTHQPVIDKLSDLTGQTVARPSGLLGGGLLALLGSTVILYFAKRYGFEYNFLAFSALFLAGFAFGLLAELAMKLRRR